MTRSALLFALIPAFLGLSSRSAQAQSGREDHQQDPAAELAPAFSTEAFSKVERERYLMGTLLRVRVFAADRTEALDAAEAAFAEVERLQRLISEWDPESALSGLNRASPGEASRPDPELFALLAEAEVWSAATEGAFEPAVGALVDAWDLRGAGRVPRADELAGALAAAGASAFTLDPAAGTVTRSSPAPGGACP